jgi:hypothetical protein
MQVVARVLQVHQIGTMKRRAMLVVNMFTACVSLAGAAGSLADIVRSAQQFSLGL